MHNKGFVLRLFLIRKQKSWQQYWYCVYTKIVKKDFTRIKIETTTVDIIELPMYKPHNDKR